MAVNDMLRIAVEYSGKPVKRLASECGYSVDAFYATMNGVRAIPTQARERVAQINLVGMMASALEATGFNTLFGYLRVDRHILSLLQRSFKEDREVDEVLKRLPELLFDKPTRADLTDQDVAYIHRAGKEIIERINADYNLLAELERQYGISFLDHLIEKEKSCPRAAN
jgi:hypothetical protein